MKALLIAVITMFSFTPGVTESGTATYSTEDPIIEGVIINDVDNPYTMEYIKSKITVMDPEDGDITHLIEIVTDNYTENMDVLGDFMIIFGVTDSGDNQVTYAIIVKNVDITAPVIELEVESTLKIPQYSVLGANLPRVTATDSYEGNLTSELIVEGLDAINTQNLGTHELTYTVSDSSGNTTVVVFTVEVVDSTKPTLDGITNIVKRANVILDGQFYLSYLSATDDHDGIITNRITVISDEYMGNANNPGTYEVVVSVADQQGNYVNHTLTIRVVNDMIPNLILDNYYWVTPDNYLLTDEDFISTLKFINNLPNNNYVFTTTQDNYTNYYDSMGTYIKSFELLSSTGEEYAKDITIEVVQSDLNIVEESPGFLETNAKTMVGVGLLGTLVILGVIGYFGSKKK